MAENSTLPMTEEVGNIPRHKHTKLGWIPKDWEIKKVHLLGDFKKGRGISKSEILDKGLQAVRYGELYTNYNIYFEETVSFVSKKSAENSKEIKKGDILFTCSGEDRTEIGKAISFQGNKETYAGGDLAIFTPNSIKSLYLSYYMNSSFAIRQKRGLSQGYSIVHIYPEQLSQVEVLVPPKREQENIVSCFVNWDTSIEKLNSLIKAKQQQKKALMQQLLTGKKRLPGFNGIWREFHLSDIAKRVNRKNTELNDNVVTISAQKGFVKQEDFFTKRVASSTLENYTLVKKGEFCYNKSYSNGYPMGAFKRLDDFDKAVVTTLYICFGLRDNVNSDFINQFFEAGRMIQGLMRIAQEGGRAHGLLNIGLSDFFALKLQLPSLQEQDAIAEVLETADAEIQLLEQKLDLLKLQKKGLMQQLLTGKKRLID